MKNLLNNWVINSIFALIAVMGVAIQEAAISTAILWPVIGIGAFAALGGALIGELIKILVCRTNFNTKQYFIGTAIGFAIAIVLTIILF